MKRSTSILLTCLALLIGAASLWIWRASKPQIKHVVLISIDTCRADYLSCYGHPTQTTPHIDALAQEATLFEYVVSPVPITLPAHSSMLTGKIPPAHGVHNNTGFQLAGAQVTLAEILKAQGYATAGFISAFVLDGQRGLGQGFDRYDDQFQDAHFNPDIDGNERKGDETARRAIAWLRGQGDAHSFTFVHFYDPHMDYEAPEPYATRHAADPYAAEIAFVDDCVGRVINALKANGMYDSSLIILTGDHGEMLGEHGELEHTYFIYESAIRVPLIIKFPEDNEARRVAEPVGIVDILPTICAALDLPVPADVRGRDIGALARGKEVDGYARALYSESMTPSTVGASSLMALSDGTWKFIQAPRPELYDVRTDPAESENRLKDEPHRARIMEDQLKQILESAVGGSTDNTSTLDAESLRRLESLGYIRGKSEGEIIFDESGKDPKDLIEVFSGFHEARKLIENKKDIPAEKILLAILPKQPDFHRTHLLLGDINMRRGNVEAGLDYYRRAIALSPDSTPNKLYNNLAWIQATDPSISNRDPAEAVRYAKVVCERSRYSNPFALDTLAVSYAATGDFDQAIATSQKALLIAKRGRLTKLRTQIEARVKLFEQTTPYTEARPTRPAGPYIQP